MDSLLQRLAQGPNATQPQDYDDWNQMVGAAPQEKFGRAVYESVRQVDPQEYARHIQPGVDGTDPLGSLMPQQRGGLMQTVLGELTRRGVGQQDISQGAGLQGIDPNSMSPQEAAQLLQWTQQNHPKAYGRVATQYQNEPNILQSLMGNKALMMALGSIGTKLASDQMNKRR